MTTPHSHLASRRAAARGFSLLELLIVIAILLALGATAVVYLMPRKAQADVDLTRADLDAFGDALEMFKLDFGRYPTEEEGITILWDKNQVVEEDDEAKWKNAYLTEPKPQDRWGNDWTYTYPSEEVPGKYEIISWGPDGEEDTDDDISSLDRLRDEDGEIDESMSNSFGDEESTG